MNAVSKKEAAALELVPAANAASAPTPGPLPTSLAANFMLTLQERGAGLEQIEKMMDLLERNERHEAEKAYNEALAAFKAKNIRWAAAGLVDTDLSFLSLLELYGTEISERRMPT
ncbi:hypothetical protein SAMN05421547_1241, partial [Delftia lacustris]